MPSMSKAISDPLVDLEKGFTGMKAAATEEEEEELVVVDPCIAMCIKITLVRLDFTFYPSSLLSRSIWPKFGYKFYQIVCC